MVSSVWQFEQPICNCLVECFSDPEVLVSDEHGEVIDLSSRLVEFFDGYHVWISEPDEHLEYLVGVLPHAAVSDLIECS